MKRKGKVLFKKRSGLGLTGWTASAILGRTLPLLLFPLVQTYLHSAIKGAIHCTGCEHDVYSFTVCTVVLWTSWASQIKFIAAHTVNWQWRPYSCQTPDMCWSQCMWLGVWSLVQHCMNAHRYVHHLSVSAASCTLCTEFVASSTAIICCGI